MKHLENNHLEKVADAAEVAGDSASMANMARVAVVVVATSVSLCWWRWPTSRLTVTK